MHSPGSNDYVVGEFSDRPWGHWVVLASGDGFVIKEISVNSGHELSLQSHQHRAEHWVILAGDAEVTLGEATMYRSVDESVFIPANSVHRIRNVGNDMLTFIEIQTGSLLSEDDIERFEDRYGRLNQ